MATVTTVDPRTRRVLDIFRHEDRADPDRSEVWRLVRVGI